MFGMQAMAVKPPAAAAAVPVSRVSFSGRPGSRRWTWTSIQPGGDEHAGGVERLDTGDRVDLRLDPLDPAVADQDIEVAVSLVGGVDDAPAANKECIRGHASLLLHDM